MTSPDENPETTPDNLRNRCRTWLHRIRARVAPYGVATLTWLRSLVAAGAERPHRHERLSPRMRSVQLVLAMAAAGVLGIVVGNATADPDHRDVRTAAHTAPLVHQSVSPQGVASPQPLPHSDRQSPERHPEKDSARRERTEESTRSEKATPTADTHQTPAPPRDPVEVWIDQATAILQRHGYSPEDINQDAIRTIIEHESGGDPGASNNWDSNAAAGTPSKGLMQTIEPTFETYALPGHTDIWNPVDNIIAATRYSIAQYGSVSEVPGVSSLESGSDYEGY